MDQAAHPRRLLLAATAGGLALLVLIGVGVYGLLAGPAPAADPAQPTTAATPAGPATSTSAPAGPEPIPATSDPETFARHVASALFGWDTASGHGPADHAQVLADVGHASEADALAADVRAYLPTADAWAQLRQYQTRQWLTIDTATVPQAWQTAVAQAAPGQLPAGATAYTIDGTRHRDGTWGTEPVEASRQVAFTVFIVCAPPLSGATAAGCELLRLSQLDAPLR